MLERVEPYNDHRIDDDRAVLGDVKRDVQVVAFAAHGGVDFGFRKPVHAVKRLHAQHVATKFHRVEHRWLGEAEPACQ